MGRIGDGKSLSMLQQKYFYDSRSGGGGNLFVPPLVNAALCEGVEI